MGRLREKDSMREVLISTQVAEALEHRLSQDEVSEVSQTIDRIRQDPISGSVVAATSDATQLLRVMPAGRWRIIYGIDNAAQNIQILNLYHKSEAQAG